MRGVPVRVAGMLLAVTLGLAVLVMTPSVAAAAPRFPAQLVAKLYTEALGRAPDKDGWTWQQRLYEQRGCTAGAVRDSVRAFYTSAEFLQLPYANTARVLALYRGAFNREPDQGGLDFHAALLDRKLVTWPQLVDRFINSPELAGLVPAICGTGSSYYFGTQPAPTPVLTQDADGARGGDGSDLQQLLDSAPAGATVELAQLAVVRLSAPLVVPAGKTLATVGRPAAREYANQGRLVRSTSFEGPMVRLESGAHLRNMWVDGQRGSYRNFAVNAINIQVMGGDGGEVSGSKISNSRGWTNVQVFGSYEDLPCGGVTVADNLITAYSSEHLAKDGKNRWTDGISVGCERAVVQGNTVVDATDVGIVVFRSTPAPQASAVRSNVIVSAGNSAYAAVGMDSAHGRGITHDFTRTAITGNTLWTGPNTHFDIGITVGTRPWFGEQNDPARGATVTRNTTGGMTAVVSTGIAVSGMHDAVVLDNDLRLSLRAVGHCPQARLGLDADGHAEGGRFQEGGTRVTFTTTDGWGCIGH